MKGINKQKGKRKNKRWKNKKNSLWILKKVGFINQQARENKQIH